MVLINSYDNSIDELIVFVENHKRFNCFFYVEGKNKIDGKLSIIEKAKLAIDWYMQSL